MYNKHFIKCPKCEFIWDRFDICRELPHHACNKYKTKIVPLNKSATVDKQLVYLIREIFKYQISLSCPCKAYLNKLNSWTIEECIEKIDAIVIWLVDEANKRNIFYNGKQYIMSELSARKLIKMAIKRAKKFRDRTTQP